MWILGSNDRTVLGVQRELFRSIKIIYSRTIQVLIIKKANLYVPRTML